MNKKTLNIASVCIISIIIVFSITQKNKLNETKFSNNIIVGENGNIQTKSDEYKSNILKTVTDENINNFNKFAKSFEKNSNDNLTDGLSKDIFTQYIKYNTYGEIKEEDVINTTQEILKNKNNIEDPATYNDIKIVVSNLVNLKIYGNEIASIQEKVNQEIFSLKENNKKTINIANIYTKTAKLLISTNVPEPLSQNHIDLINGLKKYSEGLYMMDQQEKDPAKALIGLNKVKTATDEVLTSFDKIKKTIILNKVDYTENEPGYFWISNNSNNTSIKIE